jgi:menaquinone-dependent protoporphyrinogen IX oxidase
MKVEYYHASKYGSGAKIAEEFKDQMAAKGITVNVHHVKDVKPKEISPADLYLFSSPGRFGKPIGDMRDFLKKVNLPLGTKYAVLVTEFAPEPQKSIRIPTEDEIGKCQRVIPIMNEMLQKKGAGQDRRGQDFCDWS